MNIISKLKFRDCIEVILFSAILLFIAISLINFFKIDSFLKKNFFESFQFFIFFLIQSILLLLPLYLLIIRPKKLKFNVFGFRSFSMGKALLSVLFAYGIYFIFAFVFQFIQIAYSIDIPGFKPQISPIPLFGNDAYSKITAYLSIVFMAPFIEEFFFRGFVFQSFLQKFSPYLSSLFSAVIFGLSHFEFSSFIPLFFLGLLLNALFYQYNSLWPAILFHALNNFVTLTVQYSIL